ncbi:MAG: bifunctional 4-hydroxy-3-methylbut-2-enyl diphosphate reductase/30S ribosomal protein S1 [Clostridia bacterium]|nr:bifunctional 4-hydroxy-3-methylbut-2-enyl diphosphate reductase/30S ribosomal protein S1 [Clostridia bacterium]
MEIKVAETAGFCFGVNRAVDMLYKMIDEGRQVCTLGPIIHNPQVIEDLENRGVKAVASPSEVPEGYEVVIRAHGITKETLGELEERKIPYTDATCPYVLKIHKIIKQQTSEDDIVLIAGDGNHPEVCGFRSHCKGKSYTFKTADELAEILESNSNFANKNKILLAQTTFSVKEWKKSLKIIEKLCTNSIYFDTICRATQERQDEAEHLSQWADAMLVIGGTFSSNTVKLKNVCSENAVTYLIERVQDLQPIDFMGCKKIGITAGASTPARIIKEVKVIMTENFNEMQTNKSKETQDQELFLAAVDSMDNTSTSQNVVGVVVSIAPNEIQVDIGRKYAGFIPRDEYSNDPTADPMQELKIGDKLNLTIMSTNDSEGTMKLSKRIYDRKASWQTILDAKENETVLEAVVSEAVKGGVIAYPMGSRVFIPASLTGLARNEELDVLVKQKVQFRIIDIDERRRRVIGSIRSVTAEARKAAADAFWATAEEGKTYTGTVKSLTSYGAFVDLGGVEGMIHISELSWSKIKHPSEIVNVGDTVEVYIKSIEVKDDEKKKISLGYKKIEDDPWQIFTSKYAVGDVADVEIQGLATFGAFAKIIDDVKGLIHISQIADRHIASPKEVLSIGDVVKAKITEIDYDRKRVSLSIRALIEKDENTEVEGLEEYAPEAEETVEEAVEAAIEAAEATDAE